MLRKIVNFRYICPQSGYRLISVFSTNVKKLNLYRTISTDFLQDQGNQPYEIKPIKPLDREKRLKVMELEMDVYRQEGRKVPDPAFLKPEHWEHLLTLNSRSARTKYYTFLFQLEKKKENRQRKKIENQAEVIKRKEELIKQTDENNHIIYGLNHTCLFLRIYDTTINFWNNYKLIQAMQFGAKIVFDCSYDKHMTEREAKNAAKQLMFSFAENRFNDDPFDLHFCNVDLNTTTMKYLHKHIPTLMDPDFPLNLHTKCFTEIFPKERLVYLTPHCRTDLHKYNPDDVYIVGAMVDKVNNEPLSLAKAKRLGLRMAKLPLDHYLQWGAGSGKSLTLNQMVNILLDVKNTGDWNHALRHVPRRKIIDLSSQAGEEERKTRSIRKLRSKADSFSFDLDSWGNNKRRIKR